MNFTEMSEVPNIRNIGQYGAAPRVSLEFDNLALSASNYARPPAALCDLSQPGLRALVDGLAHAQSSFHPIRFS